MVIMGPFLFVLAIQPFDASRRSSLGAAPSYVEGQQSMPTAAINAAKHAKASVEAAQKKNSDALDQTPAPQPPPATPPTGPGQAPSTSSGQGAGQGGYTYDPDGRRDPFVSLLYRGGETRPMGGTRPVGLAGLLVGEVSVKGVLKARNGLIALIQAPDNKTYIVHPGDRLMDGSVKSVAPDAVVFSQDVNDPLSLVKQREVRKTIRPETR